MMASREKKCQIIKKEEKVFFYAYYKYMNII
jgi:hypothetical protein